MQPQTTAQPKTAPHLCGLIIGALLIVFGLHMIGFRFVTGAGASFGVGVGR